MSNTIEPSKHDGTTSAARTWPVWAGAIAVVTVLFVAFWYVAPLFAPAEKMEKLGSAGDVAAILGTLFSGFAFAGVIVALYLQTRQIRSTDADVRRQTNILQEQVAALHGQTDALLKQVEVLYRPYITVWVEMDNAGTRKLHVMNTGRSAARNLSLTMDRDFYQLAKQESDGERWNLRRAYLFSNTILSFGPNSHVQFVLAGATQLNDENIDQSLMPRQFVITSHYESADVIYQEGHQIDLDQFRSSFLHKDFTVEALRSIGKTLEGIKEKLPDQ